MVPFSGLGSVGDNLKYLLSALIFSLVFIPASSFLALKIGLIFLCLIFACINILALRKVSFSAIISLISCFLVFVLLLMYLAYSVINNGDMADSHLRAFSSYTGFLIVLSLFLISFKLNFISVSYFYKVLVISSFSYSLAKLFLVLLPLIGLVSVRELKDILLTFVGSVTYEFWTEDAKIARISFGNDIIIPFVVAFLPLTKNDNFLSKNVLRFFIVSSYIGGLFSFTRFIWLAYIFIFFYDFFIIRKRYLLGFVSVLSVAISLLVLFQFEWFSNIVSIRGGDTTSLDTKSLQSYYLLNEWMQNPFLGKGIGGYLPMFLRSEYQPYIYEVQWSALLMQVGIIGVSILLIVFLYVFQQVLFLNAEKRIYVSILFVLWLMSAFTNPYLFIMSSSVVYILFLKSNQLNSSRFHYE